MVDLYIDFGEGWYIIGVLLFEFFVVWLGLELILFGEGWVVFFFFLIIFVMDRNLCFFEEFGDWLLFWLW